MSLEASRKVLLLGRGVEEVYDGEGENRKVVDYKMKRGSLARANAVGKYWSKHRREFTASDAKIVISGGYARAAGNQAPPPEDKREGALIVDYLMKGGIPSHLLHHEVDSTSTFGNYTEVVYRGFFNHDRFDERNPLLIAASKQHGLRRGVPIARAAFGIQEARGVQVLLGEKEDRRTCLEEYVGGIMTEKVIAEADIAPFDVKALDAAEDRFEELVKDKKAIIVPVLGGMVHDLADFTLRRNTQQVDLIAA